MKTIHNGDYENSTQRPRELSTETKGTSYKEPREHFTEIERTLYREQKTPNREERILNRATKISTE
jgi:hypothetical protein